VFGTRRALRGTCDLVAPQVLHLTPVLVAFIIAAINPPPAPQDHTLSIADRTESRDYNVLVEGASMESRPSNFGSSGAQPFDTKNTSPVVPVIETRKVEQVLNGRDGGTPAPEQQALFHGRLIIFALVYHVHDAYFIFQEWADQMVYLRQ
jgi:hypothetical protein